MATATTDGVFAFEGIDDGLPFVPLAGRRALDAIGRKLSLDGWLSLSIEWRRALVRAGAAERVDPGIALAVDGAVPPAAPMPPIGDPDPAAPPPALAVALGPERGLAPALWASLHPFERYALVKSSAKADKVARAYDEIVGQRERSPRLTHLTETGSAHMVDVASKEMSARRAVASARVRALPSVLEAVRAATVGKGDVLAAARIAGILAAKRTPELIPLCHPVATTRAAIDFDVDVARGELRIEATVEAFDRTGVEMEALVAASIAALTIYDMIKSGDHWARIEVVQLEQKTGGKSGDVTRPRTDGERT